MLPGLVNADDTTTGASRRNAYKESIFPRETISHRIR